MLELICKVTISSLLFALASGCDAPKSKATTYRVDTTGSTPQPTRISDSILREESAESLCKRLWEIKKLPYRDPADTDPVYEALIAKGNEAVPCLIEKITDETLMEDPREAPSYQFYTIGDTAVFVLVRITKDEKMLQRMLPPKYQKEWKTEGVYAYFDYVAKTHNRRELQTWWRNWIKAKHKP